MGGKLLKRGTRLGSVNHFLFLFGPHRKCWLYWMASFVLLPILISIELMMERDRYMLRSNGRPYSAQTEERFYSYEILRSREVPKALTFSRLIIRSIKFYHHKSKVERKVESNLNRNPN